MTTITLDIPRDWWLTSNGRLHRMVEAQRKRWLRQLAASVARGVTLAPAGCQQYRAVAWIAYPRGATGRTDPNNAHPTTKAIIDGFVDAGLLADDDSKHLLGPDHRRDVNTCTSDYRVRIVFEAVMVP